LNNPVYIVANWIGHIQHRNCLLKHVVDGKIKAKLAWRRKLGGRNKQLLDDLKENMLNF
jgi:hypothetical protein